MAYDPQNIFAKILRGEIPSKKVYEDDFALAFYDINPHAPVDILVVPKGAYLDFADFIGRATEKEIAGFGHAVVKTTELSGIASTGYRVISNSGAHSGQEVPHYHVHVLGGRHLGPLVVKDE